mgnify:FL=1|tara:strand:- start:43 stop:186 length:144 start_codon:yes stop_codon:yes gene_type:complete
MTIFKWIIQYNGNDCDSKMFQTYKEAKDHWQKLWNRKMYGYTIKEIK